MKTNKHLSRWLGVLAAASAMAIFAQTAPVHAVTTDPAQSQATASALDEYVTVMGHQSIYKSLDDLTDANAAVKDAYHHTYHVTGQTATDNGDTYYKVTTADNQELGYLRTTDTQSAGKNSEGVMVAASGYATLTQRDRVLTGDFAGTVEHRSNDYFGETFEIRGQYFLANGKTVYALYDNGTFFGYAEAGQFTLTAKTAGTFQADDRYVTVKSRYTVWSNFSWAEKASGDSVVHHTYRSVGKITHRNGSTYLSLVDHTGKWVGFINQDAVDASKDSQGTWYKVGKYTTFTGKSVPTYTKFGTQQRYSGAKLYHHTYWVSGVYYHYNGTTYYSLYNGKTWMGYVQANKVELTTKSTGLWTAADHYATVTTHGQKIWPSFSWKSGKLTSSYFDDTYHVKGQYYKYKGATYASLYTNKNKWLGYVNTRFISNGSGKQGAWIKNSHKVRIASKNYKMYTNFNWKVRHYSKNYLNKTYSATGKYHHFNGSWYYSLYNGKTWMGYVNVNATAANSSRTMNIRWASQFTPISAPEGCSAVSLEMLLAYKRKSPGHYYLLQHLPQYPQYAGGQVGNPITGAGFKRVTSVGTLTSYGQRFYKNLKNISNCTENTIISEVLNGHPVLYYGFSPYQTSGYRNHCKVIAGYSPSRGFKVLDPCYSSKGAKAGSGGHSRWDRGAVSWVSTSSFYYEWAKNTNGGATRRAIALY